jgi:hypothetical protein
MPAAGGTLGDVEPHDTARAWLLDGPASGAIRDVKRGSDGRPPALLMLCGSDLFVGVSDLPQPATYAVYELCSGQPDDGLWPYRYAGTL